ncbi:AraC-like DNA-binding protein [Algoriphagus sp. 4150]|uniref:helix-turn-helix transcriptional regulator n=1 Tax=Algoriphagus sp. 4150 TaxID=2817756 RepID=UPI00286739FB|nr:AraC family transcriptional regulator [Algoriphagus sp. 4150]MDR7129767.1 AraC-like DNA-binding protein [Algoriphagus sp. 4150]
MRRQEIALKNKLEFGELFKVSRFKEAIKRTKPHTHDGYYELILIKEGKGFHLVETENFPVTVPELYFLKPDQLHCWQFTAIPKGFVLLFKEAFFDPLTEAPILDLIRNLNPISRVSLQGDYDPSFLFEEILREYNEPNEYAIHTITGHLRSIFSKILQLSNLNDDKKVKNNLNDRFMQLLPIKCPEFHKVNQFAELLHTTPQNLNAACRKHTSKSASEHIVDQMILEAKRYILHTDLNIGEITDALHFNDSSYFVKFFKKQEGITPFQFREKYFQ